MRPSAPVPAIRLKSMPCSLAMRRASGEERMRPTCGGAALATWADLWTGLLARQTFGRALAGACGRQRCYGSAGFADDRDHRVDLDRGALGKADLSEHAGHGRGNLGVHLVGGDFEERLVFFDGVADLLEPFGDRALEDRLAHLGHDDFSWHASLFRASGLRRFAVGLRSRARIEIDVARSSQSV